MNRLNKTRQPSFSIGRSPPKPWSVIPSYWVTIDRQAGCPKQWTTADKHAWASTDPNSSSTIFSLTFMILNLYNVLLFIPRCPELYFFGKISNSQYHYSRADLDILSCGIKNENSKIFRKNIINENKAICYCNCSLHIFIL